MVAQRNMKDLWNIYRRKVNMEERRRPKLLNAKKDERGNLYLTYETTDGSKQTYNMGQDGIFRRKITGPLPDKLYNLSVAEAYQLCCVLHERGW